MEDNKSGQINVAIIGVGNCASSLVQGIHYYADADEQDCTGLMHTNLAGYRPSDLKIVAAFDIDTRKVGKDVAQAISAAPNCTTVFQENIPETGAIVQMGQLLDGFSAHLENYPEDRRFVPSETPQPDKSAVVKTLKETGADVLVNYLPVGSQQATEFYAECALEAGVAFVNNIPVFIASNPVWAKRFEDAGVPIIGDDIKSQVGATIVHRVLTDLFP